MQCHQGCTVGDGGFRRGLRTGSLKGDLEW